MSSAKVDITVRGAGKVVDGPLLRPVRVLPTRYAGVVYGGTVYPLHTSNVIDLEDESYDKYDCDELVELGSEIPYAPMAEISVFSRRPPTVALAAWYVENNQYGNYLVFDADEDTAQAAADLMIDVGLGVRRWDASWRPASDGNQYDWFIRLDYDGPRDECVRLIEQALTTAGLPSRPGVSASAPLSIDQAVAPQQVGLEQQVRDLLGKVAALEGQRAALEAERDQFTEQSIRSLAVAEHEHHRAKQLAQQLATAECTDRTLRRELDITRRRRQQAEADVKVLTDLLDSARREAGADTQTLADERVASLQQDLDQFLGDYERDLQEKASLAGDNDRLTSEIVGLQQLIARNGADLDDARAKISDLEARDSEVCNTDHELRTVLAVTRGGASRGRVTVEQFLKTLLPRIDLDEEGLEALLQLKKPQRILDVLRGLDDENPSPASELIRGEAAKHARIQEVKRPGNTGDRDQAKMGRIHWHRSAGRLNVLVHVKNDIKDQDQTLLRFARRCRQAEQRARAS